MELRTTDPDAAAAALADEYTDVTIQAPRGRRFVMELDAFPLPQLRYGQLIFSESRVLTRAYPSYNLCVPVGGSLLATADDVDDVVSGTDLVMISPGSRIDARYPLDGVVLRTVQFDADLALTELSALLGRCVATPPRFRFAMRPAASASIRRAVAILNDELRAATPIAGEPVLIDRLSRVIISALLLGQTHTYSAELQGRPYVEGPRTIRALVSRLEADPLAFATVGDLAAAAGLSVRALQDGFRRHLGVSPMRHLRQARLDRAHQALLAADPRAVTATAIAHAWGFAHYGRFAGEYRARFGVTPTQSLRRTRADEHR
ncbi:AraC family transcriptional regulator [Sporichthya polymorpha]|uniref:AraC family transcriptional regulator n=1 Tax=Sporichthya polymorpha TaxID=35751 RepID=UPI000360512A|nr:helix-turn-helix domain-containing protein [Sporichthya polymorpha]